MNIIDELGELALSTRLVRLSEITRRDVSRIYKESSIDFESRWFPILYVLSRRGTLSITGLAEELGYSHPSVIALVREMEKAKWVKSFRSKTDKRKRILMLTEMARRMERKMKPLWDKMRIVARQIYNNNSSLLQAVIDVETALDSEGYYERFQKLER